MQHRLDNGYLFLQLQRNMIPIQYANLDETKEERKAYDLGAFVCLTPAKRDTSTCYYHRVGSNSNSGIVHGFIGLPLHG